MSRSRNIVHRTEDHPGFRKPLRHTDHASLKKALRATEAENVK